MASNKPNRRGVCFDEHGLCSFLRSAAFYHGVAKNSRVVTQRMKLDNGVPGVEALLNGVYSLMEPVMGAPVTATVESNWRAINDEVEKAFTTYKNTFLQKLWPNPNEAIKYLKNLDKKRTQDVAFIDSLRKGAAEVNEATRDSAAWGANTLATYKLSAALLGTGLGFLPSAATVVTLTVVGRTIFAISGPGIALAGSCTSNVLSALADGASLDWIAIAPFASYGVGKGGEKANQAGEQLGTQAREHAKRQLLAEREVRELQARLTSQAKTPGGPGPDPLLRFEKQLAQSTATFSATQAAADSKRANLFLKAGKCLPVIGATLDVAVEVMAFADVISQTK